MKLLAALATVLALGGAPSFEYDASAPLRVQEAGVQTYGGIAVHDLSYASPVRGRVPAYLVLPPGKGLSQSCCSLPAQAELGMS